MEYTKKSAGIDALILGVIAVIVTLGLAVNSTQLSELFIVFGAYAVGTVFILSHFYASASGVLYTSNVLCRKVMVPPSEFGCLTWGVLVYFMATVAVIFIFVGESGHP